MAAEKKYAQNRGDDAAYARYLKGMNASMRQKVAMTAAFFLCRGRVADMGMGSGAGSAALAALYPGLEVVGVDIDPEMVERARDEHRLPNLDFVVGDVAAPVMPDASLDGIFDSSVLHHVTSFGGYEKALAEKALGVQVRALREGGVLVVRDFVSPGAATVELEVRDDDGDGSDDPRSCSTARLLLRFAREARSLHPKPGFPLEELPDAEANARGARRFRLSHHHAAEFVLRKDYRNDWAAELKEEYGYFTQDEFEDCFARLGLRVLASTPIRNPWIVRNRFEGKIALRDAAGAALPFPATNILVAGERVPADEGVLIREAGPRAPVGFLELACHRDRRTGRVRDLVRRPNATVDVVPWFATGTGEGELQVLARTSYPRPILGAPCASPALEGSRSCTYVAEPLIAVQGDLPVGLAVERVLERTARVEPREIRAVRSGHHYFPSPGGTLEQVRSMLVEIEPAFVEEHLENESGFSTGGRVAAISAQQILRAAQVGALPDARLEANVYVLHRMLGRSPGPWIGADVEVGEAKGALPAIAELRTLLERPPRRAFLPAKREESPRFLELRCADFEELAADGRVLHRAAREYVVPRTLSTNTVATAPLLRRDGRVYLGLDDDDLPAAQGFLGSSALLVAPAWRLPREVAGLDAALLWLRARLRSQHGVEAGRIRELGGRYHPSAGLTPEVVHPLAVEVLEIGAANRPLLWVPLEEVVAELPHLLDGHLRIVALRAAHALGMLGG